MVNIQSKIQKGPKVKKSKNQRTKLKKGQKKN